MYPHHIEEMAAELVKSGLVEPHREDLARATLRHYWRDKMALTWTRQDVLDEAENMGAVLTTEQADEVLSFCLHKHDADQGVNWEVIRAAILEVDREDQGDEP